MYQVLFIDLNMCMYVYVWETTISENEVMNLKEEQGADFGGFLYRKRREEIMWLYYNLKKEKNN